MLQDLQRDLHQINTRVYDLEKYAAVTNEKLGAISKSVDTMTTALVRVLWIMGSSVLVAVATFILKGGLVT